MEDKRFFKTTGGWIAIIAICYAIVLFIECVFPDTLGIVLSLICIGFGWKTLNSIQPVYFLWLPMFGWIIYILVKLVLAYTVGLFVAPYKIGDAIFQKIQ